MHTRAVRFLSGLCLILAGQAWADDAPASTNAPSPREINLASVKQRDLARTRSFASLPDFMVRPGLLADRTGRVVHVDAESIHLRPGDPVEFPLITQGSGKDYESLAVAFASASDLRDALIFIGLKPGQCVDSSKLRFWPRGDRVKVLFHYTDMTPSNTIPRAIPSERLILDNRKDATLPECGFIFTGSEWLPAVDPSTGMVFAADAYSPGAIVSVYNDGATLLDVPRRVSQGEVYTSQVPNPELLLPANRLIEITLEPYFRDDQPHQTDLTLRAIPSTNSRSDVVFILQDAQGKTLNTNPSVSGFLAALATVSASSSEVHLAFTPDDSLTLAPLQKAALLINGLDREEGARIGAPPAGHPYFKALLPDERYRKREARPSQAAELHLEGVADVHTARVDWIDMEWKGDSETPEIRTSSVPLASATTLAAALVAKAELPPVMLVFAPGTMRYGAIREYLKPLLERSMILYVFAER